MDQAEVQALYLRFAAVLAEYGATAPDRKELATMLARSLWLAMIAGPEMEEETGKVLKNRAKLDDESVQIIKQMYFEQMRPVVSEDQLTALRRRYPIPNKPKEKHDATA
jgi:hypothetical protein